MKWVLIVVGGHLHTAVGQSRLLSRRGGERGRGRGEQAKSRGEGEERKEG
jgi:hypothetical protein